ncbi:MAG: aspartate carbamoyltransferase regulatory subunit [Muribaculaceae bacterium]|nr:aspartate carbamoyltransferase regulatory subunit [Muribaculaceae bacterium]
MTQEKKELAVAALRNGTVIDHIPSSALFKAVRILGIEDITTPVTIGNNLPSRRLGAKGIIKVADVEYPESVINRIAIIAPSARINVIRDFDVVEKRTVQLPDTVVGLVKCDNPKCITNNEPMKTVFHVVDRDSDTEHVVLKCHYCNHTVDNRHVRLL